MANLYPGVQTLRIPSGSRSITPVGTSTTAFIGIFKKGPVDKATRITSWGQFVTIFGGHWTHSDASYAVEHYFLNGGGVAYIVRTTWGTSDAKATATINIDGGTSRALDVTATSEGAWGNNLRLAVAHNGSPGSYDLLIREHSGTQIINEEVFAGLSTDQNHPRFADKVINGTSALVTVAADDGDMPGATLIGGSALSLTELQQADLLTDGITPTSGADGNVMTPTSSTWEATARTALRGDAVNKTGLYALDRITPDRFSLMCIPVTSRMSATNAESVLTEAKQYCKNNYAFLLIGASDDSNPSNVSTWFTDIGVANREYSAGFFPRIEMADPDNGGAIRSQDPSGAAAGIIARTDANRGFWKSPAGTEAGLGGGQLEHVLSDLDQEPLNRAGVNCFRQFPIVGTVLWGARTLAGADALASEYKYIAVARTSLVIEASLRAGLQYAVFEPNDERLWGNIRLTVGAFMAGLHRDGAFQGASAKDAYFVKCDGETTTQGDIDRGVVNVIVGFAPLKPAEFVFVKIQQITQAAT